MQIAEIVRRCEFGSVLIVLWQQYAEVIIPHVRREIVSDDTLNTLVGISIHDIRLQYLNQWEGIVFAFRTDFHFNRNDFEFNGIAIASRVIPMRQRVETIVNHSQGVTEVVLAVLSSGQISKIRRDTRIVQRVIVLIKTMAHDAERKVVMRRDMRPIYDRLALGGDWNCGLRHNLPQ